MKINVGTTNPGKIEAVKLLVDEYQILNGAVLSSIKVDSGVNDQPMSLPEVIEGAKNRAKRSFKDCDYSIGLESGLFSIEIEETEETYFDICACAIYDGKDFFLGFSGAFQVPTEIMDKVMKGKNLTQATFESGLTENQNIGQAEGLIGLLTQNHVTRTAYTLQALKMAMAGLQQKEPR